MATWHSPRSWPTTGYVVTALDLNEQIRDNELALHGALISTLVNYTLAGSDGHNVTVAANAQNAPLTIGLYTAIGNAAAFLTVRKTDSGPNTVTVDPAGAQTIDGAASVVLTTQGESITVQSDGANWMIVAWRRPTVVAQPAGTYSVRQEDDVVLVSAGTFTVTLPPAANPRYGRQLLIKNRGTGIITVAGDSGQLLDADATVPLYGDDGLTLLTTGSGWIIV